MGSQTVSIEISQQQKKTKKKKQRPMLKSTQSMKDESIITEQLLPSSYKRNYRHNQSNADMQHPILHKSNTITANTANHSQSNNAMKRASVKASGSRWSNHPLYKDFDHDNDNKENVVETTTPNTIKSKPPPPPKSNRMQPLNLNNKEDANRKYGQDTLGFSENTLDDIDKCNMEHLMGALHEGSECLKILKMQWKNSPNSNKRSVQIF